MTQHTTPSAQLQRYQEYLRADPGNAQLLARCIDLALACNEQELAARLVEDALLRHPGDLFFRFRQANLLLARREWDAAARVLEPIHAHRPELPVAFNLATAYSWLGQNDKAWQVLAPFSDSAELNGEAAALVVRVQHHRGEIDSAMQLADQHAERAGQDLSFLAAAGIAYFDGGRIEDALAFSERALAGGRRPAEALVASGSLLLGAGDAQGARQRFEEALALNGEEGRAWNGLGVASLLAGDFDAARDKLEQALRRMPGHIGTWQALGWTKFLAEDIEGAADAFGRALALDRNFADSHGAVAVVEAARGRRAEAEAALERALRLDRSSLSAAYARMLLDGENTDPARFRQLALRLLSSRQALPGTTVADLVARATATAGKA